MYKSISQVCEKQNYIQQINKISFSKKFFKAILLLAVFFVLRFAGDISFCFSLCFGLYVSVLFCNVGLVSASIPFLFTSCFWGIDLFLCCLGCVGGVAVVFVVNKLSKKQCFLHKCTFLQCSKQIKYGIII